MIPKYIHFSVVFAMTTIVAAFVLCSYWLFWPYPPLNVRSDDPGPIPILDSDKILRHGDVVEYRSVVDHNYDWILVTRSAQLVNEVLINYPTTSYLSRAGREEFISRTYHVPEFAPPGTYHIEFFISYRLNPLRTETIVRRTEDFEVVAR